MIRKEILTFAVVGVLTVLVDFASYRLLMYAGINIEIAKALGFIAGTGFAYFANRHWTFAHRRPVSNNVIRFGFLYATTLCVNVVVNKLCLVLLAGSILPEVELAFVVATGCSATLNFLGMKFFVFHAVPSVNEVEK